MGSVYQPAVATPVDYDFPYSATANLLPNLRGHGFIQSIAESISFDPELEAIYKTMLVSLLSSDLGEMRLSMANFMLEWAYVDDEFPVERGEFVDPEIMSFLETYFGETVWPDIPELNTSQATFAINLFESIVDTSLMGILPQLAITVNGANQTVDVQDLFTLPSESGFPVVLAAGGLIYDFEDEYVYGRIGDMVSRLDEIISDDIVEAREQVGAFSDIVELYAPVLLDADANIADQIRAELEFRADQLKFDIEFYMAAIENDAPVISNQPDDQAFFFDTAFSFTVPVDAFSDVDDAQLTYSASLADGSPLPEWLLFDPETRTFSGTAPSGTASELNVVVTASDGRLSADLTLGFLFETDTPVNNAPIVATPLNDQSSPEDNAVNFTIPAAAFSDADGDALTLSAALEDGAALPAWLAFDAVAGSFAGTPPANFNGELSIRVTASDGALETSDVFTLDITPVNDAPVRVLNYGTFTGEPGDTFTFNTVPVFADADGDVLSYTFEFFAFGENGGPAPDWLSEGPTPESVLATLPVDSTAGEYVLRVVASDGTDSAFGDIRITINTPNRAPVVAVPLADQVSAEDEAFGFIVPSDTFADIDGDTLTLDATLSDGASLPVWLTFDETSRSFAGTPPANFNGTLSITVTASDGEFDVSDTFDLDITPVNDAPVLVTPLADQTITQGDALSIGVPADAFDDGVEAEAGPESRW